MAETTQEKRQTLVDLYWRPTPDEPWEPLICGHPETVVEQAADSQRMIHGGETEIRQWRGYTCLLPEFCADLGCIGCLGCGGPLTDLGASGSGCGACSDKEIEAVAS